MKYACRYYVATGEFISQVTLDSEYDKVNSLEDAYDYCREYLTSQDPIKKGSYWICSYFSKNHKGKEKCT
jgi:hypothetical protein